MWMRVLCKQSNDSTGWGARGAKVPDRKAQTAVQVPEGSEAYDTGDTLPLAVLRNLSVGHMCLLIFESSRRMRAMDSRAALATLLEMSIAA